MLSHTMLSTTTDVYVDMVEDISRDAATKLDGWFDNEDQADSADEPDETQDAG